MKLTKEMCEEALKVLEKEKLESMADVVDKVGALGVVDELIKEHFELVEKFNWLKDCFSGETFNLIFTDKKSVEDWFERMKWHVKKCNELSSELRELKSNPPLKFEELKAECDFMTIKKTDLAW